MSGDESSHAQYPMSVAAESISSKRKRKVRRFSHHLCPKCSKELLERKRLPVYLRPLRVIPGLSPRRYICDGCGRRVILWRKRRN